MSACRMGSLATMAVESFTRTWRGWTRSSEGYAVRIMGRNDLQYEDEFGLQHIFVEPLGRRWNNIDVETTTITEHSDRPREVVVDRLRRVFAHRGWVFIERPTDKP